MHSARTNNTKYSGHFVPQQRPRAAHALRSDQYQLSLREAQSNLEEQQRAKEIAHDELINAERKANSNQNALEESRTLLEQADRARRMVEQELADTNETLSEQSCTNQANQGAKQKLESEMSTLQVN